MRTKIIASLVAGGLLIGAGFATSIISAPSMASAQEEAADDDAQGLLGRGLALLGEVLDELVTEETLTTEQAEAVVNAVQEKARERKAEMEAHREQMRGFLEDGVLTEEEFNQLPDRNPFADERFDEAWEDGELTKEEIWELRPHHRHDAFKRGLRFGAFADDGGIDLEEWESIPEDHPIKQIEGIEDYLDDGIIDHEEIRELLGGFKDQLRERNGLGPNA